MKDIIEELGLEGEKSSDTQLIASQSRRIDSDFRAWILRDVKLDWELVANLNYWVMYRPDFRYDASIIRSHAASLRDADMVKSSGVE